MVAKIKKTCQVHEGDEGVNKERNEDDGPPTYLELEWVYGYNSR